MSIDLFMEDEEGASLGEVLDPEDLCGRIVALAGHGDTTCLRFIHSEGNTVFNQYQIPTLIRELKMAREYISEDRLTTLSRSELTSAREARWAPSVLHALEVRALKARPEELLEHLEKLIELAEQARGRAHTYLKFYGD